MMDFSSLLPSSLMGGGEFSTPVGGAVEKATSELLIGPDWTANLEICDAINGRPDGVNTAVRAIRKRFKSENPKVIQLTLTLCEACVKNCSPPLHQAFASREFMTDVLQLTDGRRGWEVKEQALALVQQWGEAFQHDRRAYPGFADAYGRLRAQGIQFPRTEDSAPVFTPPAARGPQVPQGGPTSVYGQPAEGGAEQAAYGAGAPGGLEEGPSRDEQLEKLRRDLEVVKEKVILCQQMLPNSAGAERDEALAEVVGFLEACRPRIVDLIEAGTAGQLGEDLFEWTLKINDALLRTLDAERTGQKILVDDLEAPAAARAGGPAPPGGAAASLIDFGGDEDDAALKKPPAPKSSSFSISGDAEEGEEDAFAGLSLRDNARKPQPPVQGTGGLDVSSALPPPGGAPQPAVTPAYRSGPAMPPPPADVTPPASGAPPSQAFLAPQSAVLHSSSGAAAGSTAGHADIFSVLDDPARSGVLASAVSTNAATAGSASGPSNDGSSKDLDDFEEFLKQRSA